MPDVLQAMLEAFGEGIIYVILASVLIVIALAWGRRRMQGVSNSWVEIAQTHSLEYVESGVSFDYGELVGEQSWDLPGLAGNYKGREIRVQSGVGTAGKEAGRYLFESSVQLKTSVPFTALTYKTKFSDDVKSHIPKDTPTQNRAIDSKFKIRSENPQFIVPALEQLDLAKWLNQHKYVTTRITLQNESIIFSGAAGRFSGKPEEAIALLDMLCNLADKIES